MGEIPESHPRRRSLLARQNLVEAAKDGLLAESAMIAHGRGEAFDYLLGEKTSDSARMAICQVAARLVAARRPVLSLNGNTAILAGKQLIRIAAVLGCPLEVNIYYRTEKRMQGLLAFLEKQREEVSLETAPIGYFEDWKKAVLSVQILGGKPDGRISGLEGPRALCESQGIEQADAVLVPLEDGDRCEALVALGKDVLVIDLNPLSRTARMASVTIVDEVSRASEVMLEVILNDELIVNDNWDNPATLQDALDIIAKAIIE